MPVDDARPIPTDELAALFDPDPEQVAAAVARGLTDQATELALPAELVEAGLGSAEALRLITPYLRAAGRRLGDPGFLAHMDPPTPWPTWVATLLGASTNQNLLHPDTAPAAHLIETAVVDWLAPDFTADPTAASGHLVPGSTVANLTSLWAARDLTGARTVVVSSQAHLSIRKAAAILGLDPLVVSPGPDEQGSLTADALAAQLPAGLNPAATIVVATAGTTGVGAIDDLNPTIDGRRPAWVHVDAAWAGPLRLSGRHRDRLAGIEQADSVAVSAHKWLFQPKESALVLFADGAAADEALSFGGAYLQRPNVGLLGSHGTAAAPLAATLLHLGRDGIARLIDHSMALADRLLDRIEADRRLQAYGPNATGVVAWRHRDVDTADLVDQLERDGGDVFVSTVEIDGTRWLRSVAANPMADPDRVVEAVLAAAEALSS